MLISVCLQIYKMMSIFHSAYSGCQEWEGVGKDKDFEENLSVFSIIYIIISS